MSSPSRQSGFAWFEEAFLFFPPLGVYFNVYIFFQLASFGGNKGGQREGRGGGLSVISHRYDEDQLDAEGAWYL